MANVEELDLLALSNALDSMPDGILVQDCPDYVFRAVMNRCSNRTVAELGAALVRLAIRVRVA